MGNLDHGQFGLRDKAICRPGRLVKLGDGMDEIEICAYQIGFEREEFRKCDQLNSYWFGLYVGSD